MVDCMIQVKENESVRNVAKNSLTEVTLLEDSVFFGINGSGKSTVCEPFHPPQKLYPFNRCR